MLFAIYLRDAMRAVGIDPDQRGASAELARRADVSESQTSRWLKRGDQPSIENLRKIAPVLRVRMLDLLVKAGYVSSAEAATGDAHGDTSPTAEDTIMGDDDLTPREKRMLLAMLAEARERTGNGRADDPEGAPASSAEHDAQQDADIA